MSREFAKLFYDSVEWESCRKAYMSSVGGLCERCLAKGLITPAKIVHHKQHLTPSNINDPNITTGFSNLEALCWDCHAEEHGTVEKLKQSAARRNNRRWRVDVYGNVSARVPPQKI